MRYGLTPDELTLEEWQELFEMMSRPRHYEENNITSIQEIEQIRHLNEEEQAKVLLIIKDALRGKTYERIL